MLMLGSAGVWAQPFLSGPTVLGGNGERLATLALLPLLTAVAIVLRDVEMFSDRRGWLTPTLVIASLAVMSLHHIYSAPWTPLSGSPTGFRIAYAIGSALVVAITLVEARGAFGNGRHPPLRKAPADQ